jgi:hypothetical protein
MEVTEHTTGLKQRPVETPALNDSAVKQSHDNEGSDSDGEFRPCLLECAHVHQLLAFIILSR